MTQVQCVSSYAAFSALTEEFKRMVVDAEARLSGEFLFDGIQVALQGDVRDGSARRADEMVVMTGVQFEAPETVAELDRSDDVLGQQEREFAVDGGLIGHRAP
jgi:hypothetical protein